MVNINDPAPDFTLLNADREQVTLSAHREKKVILAFFPAAFTGGCKKELCTFRDSLGQLNNANATIFGISVDAPFSNGAFASQNGVEFPILSDYTREAVRAYGVALDDFAGMPGYTAAQRAVFIVNEEGAISYKWIADNPGQEPDYTAVIGAL
jgi:peroxiredoxin